MYSYRYICIIIELRGLLMFFLYIKYVLNFTISLATNIDFYVFVDYTSKPRIRPSFTKKKKKKMMTVLTQVPCINIL